MQDKAVHQAVMVILSIFLCLSMMLLASWAQAAQVTLAWDANSEPDLAGYRMFYRPVGQNYDYQSSVWEGVETTCTVEVDADGYFVARAFDQSGNESGDSNEVFEGRITPPEDPKSLLISAIELAIQALGKLKEAVAGLGIKE